MSLFSPDYISPLPLVSPPEAFPLPPSPFLPRPGLPPVSRGGHAAEDEDSTGDRRNAGTAATGNAISGGEMGGAGWGWQYGMMDW